MYGLRGIDGGDPSTGVPPALPVVSVGSAPLQPDSALSRVVFAPAKALYAIPGVSDEIAKLPYSPLLVLGVLSAAVWIGGAYLLFRGGGHGR